MDYRQDWNQQNHPSSRPAEHQSYVVLDSNHDFGNIQTSGAMSSPGDLSSTRSNMAECGASDMDSWDMLSIPSPSVASPSPNDFQPPEMSSPSSSQSQNIHDQTFQNLNTAAPFDMLQPGALEQWATPMDQAMSFPPFVSMPLQSTLDSFDHLYPPNLEDINLHLQSDLGGERNVFVATHPQHVPIISPTHGGMDSRQSTFGEHVGGYTQMGTRSLSQDSSNSSLNLYLRTQEHIYPWSMIPSPTAAIHPQDTQSVNSSEQVEFLNFNIPDTLPQMGESVSSAMSPQDHVALKLEDLSSVNSLDITAEPYDTTTTTLTPGLESQVQSSTSNRSNLAIRTPHSQKAASAASKNSTSSSPREQSQAMQHTFDLNGGKDVKHDSKPYAKKVGGRPRGKHLDENVAARARQMREVGACWNCCLQRETCSGSADEPCDRCKARQQRNAMDGAYSLGCCSRTKMYDLREEFLPDIVIKFHKDKALQNFFEENIETFVHGSTYTIEIDAIWTLPRIKCQLFEFRPLADPLGNHMTLRNGKFHFTRPNCIPLALSQTSSRNKQDLIPFETYVQQLINENLEDFANICYDGLDNDFMDRLLHLLVKYKARDTKDHEILNHCFRLLISIHVFTHSLSIPQDQFRHLVGRLHADYLSNLSEEDEYWYPRVANRQLKYFFLNIATQSMEFLLTRMQRILAASAGKTRWISAFVCMISLGMALEELQSSIALICQAETNFGRMDSSLADDTYRRSCSAIDEQFLLMIQIFQGKYGRTNPVRDQLDEAKRNLLGDSGVELVQGIKELIEEHRTHLFKSQYECPPATEADKFYSRQSSRFISSFFWPSSTR